MTSLTSELWLMAGLMLIALVALHFQYTLLNTGKSLRHFWSDRKAYRAPKLCFVLSVTACPIIVFSPYVGAFLCAGLFATHGLLALRK